ncbi:MAG: hypothetical protein KY439_09130 [Actinobacteria bacterium]|nr:hypothetical protein [Actinomycetota bacterium]
MLVPERLPTAAPGRLALAAVIALAVVVRLLLGLAMKGPIVHGDEAGYILNARWLADGGPVPGTRYFPGYSLLLVPAAWLTQSPLAFYRAIIVTNALLGGLFSLAAWGLTAAFLERARTTLRLTVTAAVSLCPSFVLYSNLALSENALAVATMGTAYLLKRSTDGDRTGPMLALALGMLSAYQVIVHPRGAGALLAAGLVAAVFWRPWRPRMAPLALLAGAVVVLAVGAIVVSRATSGGAAVSTGYGVGVVTGGRLSLAGMLGAGAGALGQVLYLVAATFGLVVIGFCAAARQVREWMRSGESPAAAAVALFALTTSVVVLAMSAWLVGPGGSAVKPDSLIYGRLNEAVAGPLLLVGLCVVANASSVPGRSRLIRYGGVAALTAVVTALPVQLFQTALAGAEIDNPIGVMAVYPLQALLAGGRVAPLLLAAFAVVSVATLTALVHWKPVLVPVGVVAAFLVVSSVMALRYLLPGSARRSTQRGAVALVAVVEDRVGSPPECIAFDDADYSFWHHDNYRVFLPKVRIERFASTRREAPCGPMVITTREDLSSDFPGARLWRKLDEGLSVWVLPGQVQEATKDLLSP